MQPSLRDLLGPPTQSDQSAINRHNIRPTALDYSVDDLERKEQAKVARQSKKIQKFKREDFKKAKLKYIGLPRKLTPTQKCKRRYGVDVIYTAPVLTKDGEVIVKEKKKLVRFGKEGKSDFIDHKDNLKRLNCINKFKHTDNFLHPNFYNQYLLNSNYDNTYDAHKALVSALNLE